LDLIWSFRLLFGERTQAWVFKFGFCKLEFLLLSQLLVYPKPTLFIKTALSLSKNAFFMLLVVWMVGNGGQIGFGAHFEP
jgi:hypothetical protein